MITIHIMGGLGNQLFQIFFLISYCLRYKKRFVLPNLQIVGKRVTYWRTFFKSVGCYLTDDRVIRVLSGLRIVQEPDFRHHELPDLGDDFNFFGYFQSYKYFSQNEEEIIGLLDIRRQQENIRSPHDFETSVSLHFRIGDYKNLQQYHPICGIQYYLNCLLALQKDGVDYTIICFYEKEDKTEVDQKIRVLSARFPSFRFVSVVDDGLEDYEEMLLMSKSKHHVIANSSFSWWAAYLSTPANDRKIFYPEKWFGPAAGHDVSDLFPKHWVRMTDRHV